jgi:hypothetical protein
MSDFVVTAALMKLGYAVAAVLTVFAVLRLFDRLMGRQFADVAAKLMGPSDARDVALYFGLRFVGVCILVGMVMGCTPALAGPIFPSKYDSEIRKAVAAYWPDHPDWRAWKAQIYQESRLDPAAVSPAGAAGLAQIMPGTWRDLSRELRLPPGASPHHEIALQAGAFYMGKLRRVWSARQRSSDERHKLAQASYNAGAGNVLRAQAACDNAPLWADILPCLPQITGGHSRETIHYVAAIARWRGMMEAGL